jgi:uncharacterized membrane protein YsdA (DUF1294 family)
MDTLTLAVLVYFAALSLLAAAVTVYDKWAATYRPRRRVRERTLWWLALLGGCAVMWLTMQLARHKTKHPSFMVGLPLLLAAQLLLVGGVCYLIKGDALWLLSWLL